MTDGSGSVTGSIAYEAFGQAVATSGSSSSPYTFAATSGYRNDGDAGLTHVGARYYDAQAGRFITWGTELDQHPYLYCGHGPVNALDPSGHRNQKMEEDGGRIIDVGGVIGLIGIGIGVIVSGPVGGVVVTIGVVIVGIGSVVHLVAPYEPEPRPRDLPWYAPNIPVVPGAFV